MRIRMRSIASSAARSRRTVASPATAWKTGLWNTIERASLSNSRTARFSPGLGQRANLRAGRRGRHRKPRPRPRPPASLREGLACDQTGGSYPEHLQDPVAIGGPAEVAGFRDIQVAHWVDDQVQRIS